MDKLNYHKCDLIDECVSRYLKSFAVTQDAVDFVPRKYLKKVLRYIYKNMKRHFRKVNGADREYQSKLLKDIKAKIKENLKPTCADATSNKPVSSENIAKPESAAAT